ncbi:MAG: FeoC-like transcriptional regulator [Gammaproteobacteria bacterium]
MKPLFEVRDRLREQGMATVSQLAVVTDLPFATIEDMLAYWQRRGRVELVPLGAGDGCGSACGGGCASCGVPSESGVRVYRWRESDKATAQPVTFHRPTLLRK